MTKQPQTLIMATPEMLLDYGRRVIEGYVREHQPNASEILSQREAARVVGKTPRTLGNWVRSGKVKLQACGGIRRGDLVV